MKIGFRRPNYDEKRDGRRAPIEVPVTYVIRGERKKEQYRGVIHHASQTGLGLQSQKEIPNEVVLDLIVHGENTSAGRPFRLKGKVVWSKPKVGNLLFHAGIRLSKHSRDRRQWERFILERLRSQEDSGS